ncbi:MAG: toxin-antitoxin system YwqK family antitoxin, partial [Candidatus Dadabacteria bacterium]|nr:toxin-antitoxin system YwqK family antitoxin [Candidatus Dadabacteria bacterium]
LTLNGNLVGIRQFNENDILMLETPIRNGKKHGIEYTFYDSGELQLAEPYAEGMIHGTA